MLIAAAHVLGVVALAAVVVFCSLLPFFPGRYDPMAVPLSRMSVAVGTAGLIVVPFAGLWLGSLSSNRLAGRRRLFTTATLVAAAIAALVVALTALAAAGPSLAALTLAAGAFAL